MFCYRKDGRGAFPQNLIFLRKMTCTQRVKKPKTSKLPKSSRKGV